jgi:hypothetical protein
LIQGSVQPPKIPVSRGEWERAMVAVAAAQCGVRWQAGVADAGLLAAAKQLAGGKFSQTGYNQKR